MAILWCGGEPTDFVNEHQTAISYSSGLYSRTGYARGAVTHTSTGAIARGRNFPGGGVTSLWVSCRIHHGNGISNASYRHFGVCEDQTSNAGVYVANSSTSKIALYKYDGTTNTLLAESGYTLPYDSGIRKYDLEITNYGASSTMRLYIDSVEVVSFTGDCSVSGVTSLSAFALSTPSNSSCYKSEIIVANEDTRTMSLRTLAPNAAGDSNLWTGAYTDIDDEVVSDSDLIYTNTVNNDIQVNLTTLPTGNFVVKAVYLIARAARSSDSTPTSIGIGIKSGGTVDAGSGQSLSTAFNSFARLMDVNPVTSSPFTAAEITDLQLNLRALA